jgi:hypothetical protein
MIQNKIAIRNKDLRSNLSRKSRDMHNLYFKSININKTFHACSKCSEATKNKFSFKDFKYICDKCLNKLEKV